MYALTKPKYSLKPHNVVTHKNKILTDLPKERNHSLTT